MIGVLGTGWKTSTQTFNNTPTSFTMGYSTLNIISFAEINFTNGVGLALDSQWAKFADGNAQTYYNDVLSTFGPNVTEGTQGAFSYIYFSAPLNSTLPTALLYAQSGAYFIVLLETGGTFTQQQGVRLLSNQTKDLGLT